MVHGEINSSVDSGSQQLTLISPSYKHMSALSVSSWTKKNHFYTTAHKGYQLLSKNICTRMKINMSIFAVTVLIDADLWTPR